MWIGAGGDTLTRGYVGFNSTTNAATPLAWINSSDGSAGFSKVGIGYSVLTAPVSPLDVNGKISTPHLGNNSGNLLIYGK